jgi:hypothetical protein
MKASSLDRRHFFKNLTLGASATVLGPVLKRICLGAEGKVGPLRFLFVLEGNGLPPKQMQPQEIPYVPRENRDRFFSTPLAGLTLPVALAPVEPFRDRMTIIHGLSGRMCSGGHSCDHGALGAYHANGGRAIRGATIDSLLGQHRPGVFQNIALGISSDVDKAIDFNCTALKPGQSLATILHPEMAYRKLFGVVSQNEAGASFQAQGRLIDHMQADIRKARTALGTIEKEKLDAYLDAFESISRTSNRLAEARESLSAIAPVAGDKYQSKVETDRLDAQFELATAALIGGLTNSATIASGVGTPNFNVTFGGLGIRDSKHVIGHALYLADDHTRWEMSETIRAFHFSLIARSMRALANVPEGNGTMLDRTVILYLSDNAETHHSTCYEWPFVLFGGPEARLQSGGRMIHYPDYGKPGHKTINTLYNTFLHAAGSPRDDFGRLDPNLDSGMHQGPLSEILA